MAIVTKRTVDIAIGISPIRRARKLSILGRYLWPLIGYIKIVSNCAN